MVPRRPGLHLLLCAERVLVSASLVESLLHGDIGADTSPRAARRDVGFLRYWQVSQTPNFALALPILLVAAFGAWELVTSSSFSAFVRHILLGWLPRDSSLLTTSSARLVPHTLLSVAYVLLLLFASHTQIALRFASPAWVGLWAAAASIVTNEQHRLGGKVFLLWLATWNLVSLVLYAAFLPPA